MFETLEIRLKKFLDRTLDFKVWIQFNKLTGLMYFLKVLTVSVCVDTLSDKRKKVIYSIP